MNIYNLLHMAGFDEFLADSLRAAMQLDGEDAPSDEALEIMTTNAQEAVAKACFPVIAALKGAMANASNFTQIGSEPRVASVGHLRPKLLRCPGAHFGNFLVKFVLISHMSRNLLRNTSPPLSGGGGGGGGGC